jgi:subtilisin-like proprotein convertase family protein
MRISGVLPGMVMLVGSFLGFSTGAVAQGEIFNFTSTPSASIPDGEYDGSLASMACDTIDASSIPADSTIADIVLEVAIDHTWIGDLVIKLQTPDESILGVLSRPGMEEFGDDGGGCCGTGATISSEFPVQFFDTAVNDAEEMGAALANSDIVCADDGLCDYFPNPDSIQEPPSNFGDLAGGDASGDWVLCIGDAAFDDFGVFESWSLDVSVAGEPGPISITPNSIDFGDVEVGVTSEATTVTIENTDTENLEIGTLAISGSHETDFALTDDTCSDAVLEPTEGCTFNVAMTPSEPGLRSAQIDIPSSAPTSPDVVTLQGTGIDDDEDDIIFQDRFETEGDEDV